MNTSELKKKISSIDKELRKLDNLLEKQENEGVFSGDLYDEIDKLTEERDNLQKQLDEIEDNSVPSYSIRGVSNGTKEKSPILTWDTGLLKFVDIK
jgi:DNA repair exonuclease SbcCD ATPase subunit